MVVESVVGASRLEVRGLIKFCTCCCFCDSAFLNGTVEEELHMRQPLGYGNQRVCGVRRALD
jgi:hypothetical protein